jgi:hypothetical protein
MPRIEIRDPFGVVWTVMSSNPHVLQLWLIEQAERMTSTNQALPCTLQVTPLWTYGPGGGPGQSDWSPLTTTVYEMQPEKMAALHDWLEDNRG